MTNPESLSGVQESQGLGSSCPIISSCTQEAQEGEGEQGDGRQEEGALWHLQVLQHEVLQEPGSPGVQNADGKDTASSL